MEYLEYPRHLHKPHGEYLVVANEAEQAAALEAGWSLSPVPFGQVPAAPPVPPAADGADDTLTRTSRGRPRKSHENAAQ